MLPTKPRSNHPFEGRRHEAACADVMVTVGVAPEDDSGRVLPGAVWLLLFAAALFLLLAIVLAWAGAQVPTL